jgi:hypothetical protein
MDDDKLKGEGLSNIRQAKSRLCELVELGMPVQNFIYDLEDAEKLIATLGKNPAGDSYIRAVVKSILEETKLKVEALFLTTRRT